MQRDIFIAESLQNLIQMPARYLADIFKAKHWLQI